MKNKKSKVRGKVTFLTRRPSFERSFKTRNPEKAKYWDFSKNKGVRPEDVFPGERYHVSLKCEKKHSFQMTLERINDGEWCPYCSRQKPSKEYNFATENPDRAKFWDRKKNKKKATQYLPSSDFKIHFICKKAHKFSSTLSHVSSGKWCPYCAGQLPCKENNFKVKYPEKVKYWDKKKNTKKPHEVLPNGKYVAYFKCENGHKFSKKLQNMAGGQWCYKCGRERTNQSARNKAKEQRLLGANFAAIFPDRAAHWDYAKNKKKDKNRPNPEDYAPYGNDIVHFICDINPKHKFKKVISKIDRGHWCPKCKPSKSFSPTLKSYYYILYSSFAKVIKAGISNKYEYRVKILNKANPGYEYKLLFLYEEPKGYSIRKLESANKKVMKKYQNNKAKGHGYTETYEENSLPVLIKLMNFQGIWTKNKFPELFEECTIPQEFKISK